MQRTLPAGYGILPSTMVLLDPPPHLEAVARATRDTGQPEAGHDDDMPVAGTIAALAAPAPFEPTRG